MKKYIINSIRFFSLLLMLGLFVFMATPRPSHAQTFTPTYEAADCPFELPGGALLSTERLGLQCGYVTVPLNHNQPDGDTIRLPVAVLPATDGAIYPPLFMAQGGPGGDGFEIFSITMSSSRVSEKRDIVIFNQRGTPYSQPDLMCEESFEIRAQLMEGMDADAAEKLEFEAFDACYQRLTEEEGIDLSAFDSLENAADVDMIREALGYDRYHFYGVSYGTLLGLHLMNTHPEHLEAVILDSVVPPQINFVPLAVVSENRVYDEIFAYCDASAECQSQYPDLEARVFALFDALNDEPAIIKMKDDETGESVKAVLDGDTLRGIFFQSFYLPDMNALFPKIVADVESGDYSFIEFVWPLFAFDQSIAEGMYFSVICAEDGDFDPQGQDYSGIRPELADSAETDLQTFLDLCEKWPVELLPASVDDPVVSDIPTLLLAGQYDPITPPAYALAAAETLSNATVVIDPTASHGVMGNNKCIDDITIAFLDNPDKAPATDCVESIELPEIVPDNIVKLPILGDILNLNKTGSWTMGIGTLLFLGIGTAFLVWPILWLVSKFSSKERPERPQGAFWRRRLVVWLTFGFFVLTAAFLSGVLFVLVQNIQSPLINLVALPASVRIWFVIPPILFVWIAIIFFLYVRGASDWSMGERVYLLFTVLCMVTLVGLMGWTGAMTALL